MQFETFPNYLVAIASAARGIAAMAIHVHMVVKVSVRSSVVSMRAESASVVSVVGIWERNEAFMGNEHMSRHVY